jgi:bifunctional DNA-binding transcriptional regulator/antitoxin component of YhaV-PrlF toxin-antitoxin module
METMEQLGVSKIDGKNRTYIPEAVTKALKINGGNNWLSWEQDETGQIFVFKGHLRFLRTKNYQPPESGEERGERKHEQMAERTSTQSNGTGLDNAQGESHRANEKRVEDPKGEVESRDGEDASTS